MKKLTANLIVVSVETSLAFWVERLGFEKKLEVPHEGTIGFAVLANGKVELMLQSRDSLQADVPDVAAPPHRSVLYLEVENLADINQALGDWPRVVAERETFYGAREVVVRDPDGHIVFFAEHVS